MKHTDKTQQEAKKLFLMRCPVQRISEKLCVSVRIIYQWASANNWRDLYSEEMPLEAASRRVQTLLNDDNTTPAHLAAINNAIKAYENLKNIDDKSRLMQLKIKQGASTNLINYSEKKSKKGKAVKNDFRDIAQADIESKIKTFFAYQQKWWEVRNISWSRMILKSRQIGATYYFAAEALLDALLTGENQVFLSASKAQVSIINTYIKNFAAKWFNIENLQGTEKIKMMTDYGVATIYFLSTNSATAQGYNGHLYIDEYLWIENFNKLHNVATGIAAHDKYRITYFSTPSCISHPAYKKWTGKEFIDSMPKEEQKPLHLYNESEIKKGALCDDGIWRQKLTAIDAIKQGCNLFTMEKVRQKYNKNQIRQLFNCEFMNDSFSVFSFKQLNQCAIDISAWKDFKETEPQPFKKGAVSIGYDPSRTVDGASIVVLAVPAKVQNPFRLLEKIDMINQSWQYQTAVMRELCEKYNVVYIAIDITGSGSAVFETVQSFYPNVTPIHYTPNIKNKLVLKAQNIIENKRINWSHEYTDISLAFLSIKRAVTAKKGQLTYTADRNQQTGHADVAWAIMHALIYEDFNFTEVRQPSITISNTNR